MKYINSGRTRPGFFSYLAKPKVPVTVAVIYVVAFLLLLSSPIATGQAFNLEQSLEQTQLHIGATAIEVEIADTQSRRSMGLMYRQHLPQDAGMLFVFEGLQMPCFWMKNTYIPLSIAFITAEGVISSILSMEPERTDPQCPVEPIRYALEVNQGWFAQHNINAGDRVSGLPQ